jgi:hypothetical protein
MAEDENAWPNQILPRISEEGVSWILAAGDMARSHKVSSILRGAPPNSRLRYPVIKAKMLMARKVVTDIAVFVVDDLQASLLDHSF